MSTKFTSDGIKKGGKQVRELETLLLDLVQSGYDARRSLKDRWDLNEKVYRNDPTLAGVKLFDNFEPRVFPTMSPRVNRIVNQTVAALEGPGTWFQAVPDDGDADFSEALESAMQIFLEGAGFIRKIRLSMVTSALCGVGIVRVRMTDDGVYLEPIHPNDFIVAPTYGLDIRDAHLCGHRFYIPRWKVRERVKSGLYDMVDEKDAEKTSPVSPDDDPSGRDPEYDKSLADVATNRKDWELVEMWELLVRLEVGDEPTIKRIIYSNQDKKVYQIEDYPKVYGRPWYFDLRFHDEPGKWWPSGSIAQNIVGLCLAKSDMLNLTMAGSMATVANPIVISNGSLGKKLKGLSLNQIYESPYDLKVQEIPLRFDPKAMPFVMEYVDGAIEAQTGISENRLNAESFQGERVTAREVMAIENAATQNEGSYFEFLTDFIEEIAAFVQTLMYAHPRMFLQAYPGTVSPELLLNSNRKVRWQVTGHSGANSDTVVQQKLMSMLQLAAQPGSTFHYGRVEKEVVKQMNLPFNTQKLEKTQEEIAAEQQAMAAQMAMAQEQESAKWAGKPSDNGGMAQPPGMG